MRAAGLTGESDLQLWFASVLRDGIAAAAAGGFAAFKEVHGRLICANSSVAP